MTASRSETVLVRRAALRIGVQAAVLASAIVVLLSAAAVIVVVDSQRTAAVSLLEAATAHADDVTDPPNGVWLAIRSSTGTTITTRGIPAGLPAPGVLNRAGADTPQSGEVRLGGVDYQTQTTRRPDGTTVQGVLDLTANHAERNRLITALLACGAVALVIAAGFGSWLGHRAVRPLSTALALQRRFVADASHELRTPLTLLHTRAQLMRRRLASTADGAGTRNELDSLLVDSARLGEILEDLLVAADPLADRELHPVDLVDVARDVVDAAEPQATDRDIRLIGPESGSESARVSGSAPALRRAVVALVDNAVRHARTQVSVSIQHRGGSVHIDVADDGHGIDSELAPHLFLRFVAGRPTPADQRRRYGLGLAIVNDIAVTHGGHVELVDHDGPGAVLRLHLPTLR